MTPQEVIDKAAAEIAKLGDRVLVELAISPVSTMQLIGHLQLVLRHPSLPPSGRDFAKHLIDILSKGVPDDCIGMKTLIELGWNKDYDTLTTQSSAGPPPPNSPSPSSGH